MKTKIIAILVMTLLIVTALPTVGAMDVSKTKTIEETVGSDDQSATWANANYMQLLTEEEYKEKRLEVSKETASNRGWSWKSPYANYAQKGMPDFDQRQEVWKSIFDGGNRQVETTAAFGTDDKQVPSGPTCEKFGPIVAPGPNCMLETSPGGDDIARYSFCGPVALANCFWWFDSCFAQPGVPGDGLDSFLLVENYGAGDDHSKNNVPLLIRNLADNVTKTCYTGTTNISDLQAGINQWLIRTKYTYLFYERTIDNPTFNEVAQEIDVCHNVILHLGLYNVDHNEWERGHLVTCAGVDSATLQIAFSDPGLDILEGPMGNPPDHTPHPNDHTVHNDANFVSHDIYSVTTGTPFNIIGYASGYKTVVEKAVVIRINNPPTKAERPWGPVIGGTGISYTYSSRAIDKDGDKLFYTFAWNDETPVDRVGPYNSGAVASATHTWTSNGIYRITVIAEDDRGYFSSWSELLLVIMMPRDRAYINSPFLNFLQSHPNLSPILRLLLQRLGQ